MIRIAATCVCGSDFGRTEALQPINGPTPMGHEYCGIVEEVGRAVKIRQAGAIRDRLVCHVGQHLSHLPVRLPVLVHAT